VTRTGPGFLGLSAWTLLLSALSGHARAADSRAPQLVRQCAEAQRAEAISACRAALAAGLAPRRAAIVHSLLALHLTSLGRFDEAADAYRAVVALRPGDPEALQRLADALLLGQGRPTEAVEAIESALRVRPSWAEAHVTLGLAEAALAHFEEAVAAFERAAALDAEIWDRRPSARAAYEAAKRGEPWPQKSKPIQNVK
jgi:tetratricopeptide (TPR) repeat protein